MGLLTDLQLDIVNGQVTLSAILRKASVFAYDLGYSEFKTWVNNELSGYPSDFQDFDAFIEALPDYRYAEVPSYAHTFGPFGAEAQNYPVPVNYLPSEFRLIWFPQGIPVLEKILEGAETSLISKWTTQQVAFLNRLNRENGGRHTVIEVEKRFPRHFIDRILQSVRDRLLNFTLELKTAYPALDQTTISAWNLPDSTVAQVFHVTINEGGMMPVFNQPNHTVHGDQYNAAGDINFNSASNRDEFIAELERFYSALMARPEMKRLDDEQRTDIDYNIKKALIEVKKSKPNKDTVKSHIETAAQTLKEVATLAGAVTSLQKIIEVVNTIRFP